MPAPPLRLAMVITCIAVPFSGGCHLPTYGQVYRSYRGHVNQSTYPLFAQHRVVSARRAAGSVQAAAVRLAPFRLAQRPEGAVEV